MIEDHEDDIANEVTATFQYNRWHSHFLPAIKLKWKTLAVVAMAMFGALWTMAEATSYFLREDLAGETPYWLIGIFSLLLGMLIAGGEYLRSTPEGFEGESRAVQWLVHMKPKRWEARLTQNLLANRITPIDRSLDYLNRGLIWVELIGQPEDQEYIEWLKLRPENFLRMIEVGKKLLVMELPQAAFVNPEGFADPIEIRAVCDSIGNLYSEAYEYQARTRSIEPPQYFARVHEIQEGWPEVIREGISQMRDNLSLLADLPMKAKTAPSLTCTFREPDNFEELLAILNRYPR